MTCVLQHFDHTDMRYAPCTSLLNTRLTFFVMDPLYYFDIAIIVKKSG